MKSVVSLFYAATVIAAVIGALIAFFGVQQATGAPQEAAAAAIGLACGVLPYVFTRSFSCIMSLDRQYEAAAYLKTIADGLAPAERLQAQPAEAGQYDPAAKVDCPKCHKSNPAALPLCHYCGASLD